MESNNNILELVEKYNREGMSIVQACRKAGISQPAYYQRKKRAELRQQAMDGINGATVHAEAEQPTNAVPRPERMIKDTLCRLDLSIREALFYLDENAPGRAREVLIAGIQP